MHSRLNTKIIETVPIKMDAQNDGIRKGSPWGKVTQNTDLYSLEDVMSEQLASDLQDKEDYQINTAAEICKQKVQVEQEILPNTTPTPTATSTATTTATVNNTEDDFMIAQLLQLEIDKEYDDALRKQENVLNKNSRISISYDKFKSVHPVTEKEDNDVLEDIEYSSSDDSEDEITNLVFRRGVVGKGDQMKSKHDIPLTNRHNAAKVMNFPPEFDTGDKHGLDLRLSNQVFNVLKSHSHNLDKRSNRVRDKRDQATNEISLDPRTRLILFKFVNADLIDSIGGIVSTGKEATIFYAMGGKSQEILVPSELAIKVFKTTLNEFKTREKYIADDYRFKDRYKHLNPHKIVKLWAEKEMHNLMKMKRCGIRCPEVVILKKHVLIMSFIGKDSTAAPKLKDASLTDEELKIAYKECVQLVTDLYHKCKLVHADFNQFNTLWHDGHVWVIDVSQSVEPIHPMGFEFLLRDCTNIYKFFSQKKVEDVMTGEEIFNQVTGKNFSGEGEVFLSQIQKFTKEKQNEVNLPADEETTKEYNFDFHFEKSVKKRNKENQDSISNTNEDD